MRLVKERRRKGKLYYILYLVVYRGIEKSKSTNLRVVFNAPSLTSKGNSVNSIQYNWGVMQDEFFSIIVKFRKY